MSNDLLRSHRKGYRERCDFEMGIYFQEELEITSRLLGERGGYKGTIVVVRNKMTGEIIAEGRHSMFGRQASKL